MEASEPIHYAEMLRIATGVHTTPAMEDGDLVSRHSRMMTLTLSALSRKADSLLDAHWQTLFDVGLAMKFNNATLATKHWTLFPPHDRASVSTTRHALPGDISEENLELLEASSKSGHDTLDRFTENIATATSDIRR